MLAAGLLGVALGALLIVLGHVASGVPRGAVPAGWALVVVGLILVVISLFADDADAAPLGAAGLLAFGSVHVHGAGDTEPSVRVPAGAASEREPVIIAFVTGVLPLIAAAVTALADTFTAIPDWIVPTLTVLGTLTTGLAALWARLRVTPTVAPRDDEGNPLVPVGLAEAPGQHAVEEGA